MKRRLGGSICFLGSMSTGTTGDGDDAREDIGVSNRLEVTGADAGMFNTGTPGFDT